MVALLACLYFLSYADRLVLGLLAAPLQSELALSDTQFGLLVGSTFALCYTASGLILAPLIDQGNRKWIIVAGASVWTVMTTLSAFAQNFEQLLVLRLGVSIGEAALSPAAISIIGDLFPREKRAAPTSIYNAMSMLGSTAVFIYAAILYDLASSHPLSLPFFGSLAPWRASLFLIGAPGVVMVLVFAVSVSEPRRQLQVKGMQALPLRSDLMTNWRLYAGFLGGVSVLAFPTMSMFAWFPTVLVRTFGLNVGSAGTWFGTIGVLCMPLGALSTPRMLAYFARRYGRDALSSLAVALIVSVTLAVIATLLAPSFAVAVPFLALTMFLFGPMASLGFIGIQHFVPPHLRARITAIFLMMYGICGLGVGPVLIGLLSGHVLTYPAGLGHAIALGTGIAATVAIPLILLSRRLLRALPE